MTFASAATIAPFDAPSRDAEAATTVIFIRDLAVRTTVGVHASERRTMRVLLMDIDLELDASRAFRTDSLADTVDYAAVVDDVRALLANLSCQLLERLADVVAQRLIERFGARRVSVQVAKIGILKDVAQVGVRLERTSPSPAPGIKPAKPVARRARAPSTA